MAIVAGVMTGVLLTAILVITVLCLRKRHRKSQRNPEESISSSPVASSTPQQPHHLQSTGSIRSIRGGPCSAAPGEMGAKDLTLPYHRIQCPHTHTLSNIVDYSKHNYVPDSSLTHFRPLVGGSDEHAHSSSPSTVQSEVSVTDSEFHTIRECLGDFKNNNLPHNQQQAHHPHTIQTLNHPHSHPHMFVHTGTIPRTRTLWTADGRPYEAVTCAHGVEHIYQPLEHIYEEPHIWMRPLPDPQR